MSDRHVSARRADAAARLRAQSCFDRPLVLEAGAGTGKTTTLVARIVAWCLSPGWERAAARRAESASTGAVDGERVARDVLSRIAAITFTEAAAAKMAEDFGHALVALEQGTTPVGLATDDLPDDSLRRERARHLLAALEQLTVRTIHAWCRRLLARHPLAAGVHPGFQVDADERAQALVVRRQVERAVAEQYTRGPGTPLFELAVQGIDPPQIEEALLAALGEGVRAADLAADPFASERLASWLGDFAEALRVLREAGVSSLAGAKRGAEAIEAALAALNACERALVDGPGGGLDDSIDAWLDQLSPTFTEQAQRKLARWSKGSFTESEKHAMSDQARDDVPRATAALLPYLEALTAFDRERLDLARAALVPLLSDVESELRMRGIATFPALLRGARDLLVESPGVAAGVRRELDLLLVDEFQDTDRLQCEILRQLALSGPLDERPCLFLVGDPKQSIYGWRNADLDAYDEFVDELRAAGGEVHVLSVNFRSAPAILDEVERVIEPVMRVRRGLQPAFQPLVPSPELASATGFVSALWSPVEHWVTWGWDVEECEPSDLSAARLAELEARALATDLRALHADGVAWGSVAVLFRATGDLEIYLAALRTASIPYAVEHARSYYLRREVIDAAALVRCVLDPNDALALVTFLRSAVAGVPDAALIPLWARELPRLVADLGLPDGRDSERLLALAELASEAARGLPDDVPGLDRIAGWQHALGGALESLALARASFCEDPADVFVERLRALFLLEQTEAARHLGGYRAANLRRFFRELAEDLAEGQSPQDVLRRLRQDVADRRPAEEETPRAVEGGAVQLMTIHKAKGLDFDHVYIVQCHKGPAAHETPPFARRAGGRPLEYRLLGGSTLGYAVEFARAREVEREERVRSLYVAMTRARDRLVLLGKWPQADRTPTPELSRTHADLVAQSRRPDLPARMFELAEGADPSRSSWLDEDGVRWCFPALGNDTTVATASSESAVELPAAEELARDARDLRERRARAEQRSARPMRRTASSAEHRELRERQATRLNRTDDTGELGANDPREHVEPIARDAAMLAGTLVHAALESFAPSDPADARPLLDRLRTELPDRAALAAGSTFLEDALRRADKVLDDFARGPLLGRLTELAPHVVARELPVWLPPESDESEDSPVGAVVGAIDLVYRDPTTDELVVADYKTDRLPPEGASDRRAELERCARAYASQGRAYVRALEGALALERTPRFELWFLGAGEILEVSVGEPPLADTPDTTGTTGA